MKRSIILAAVVAVAAVAGGAIYYTKKERAAAATLAAPVATVLVPVSVVPVRVQPMVDRVTSYGNLVAQRTVNIVPDTAGQLMKLLFTDGQKVDNGTALAVMDDRIAQAQVQSSRAQAETDLLNLRRTEQLANRSLDSMHSLEQAQSRSAASQADLLINQRKLDQLTLRAPFGGTLGTRKVDQGAYVNAGDTIVRLDDTSQLQIEFRMPSSITQQATEGMPVHVRIPGATTDLTNSGKLSFIDPVVSTDTRSVLLRALVPNPDFSLRPGLFVHVQLDLDTHQNAVVIPIAAVMPELSGTYVFVLDDKNIARRRQILTGISDDTSIEVTSGVKTGEQVVVVGQFRLSDGDAVKVVPADVAPINVGR